YIGGDDDWRWVDPGADRTMYEAVYRMGKASIFTQDTTYGFQADSTFRFRTNGGAAIFEWVRGNLKVPEKTWLFRAPGGGTGASQDDQNSITIARTNPTTTRTTIGKIRFAAPFGVGDSLRVGAIIDALDEEGGGATSNVSLNFYTRQLGESFIRNTMTIEGNGRLELDRYNLFSDGVPANFLGYDVTDKDVKRHPISGTPQANFVPGINATNTGLEWKDPSTFGPTAVNIYNSDGSIPAAVNRVVTVPTDGNVSFVRGNYTLGYQTTGLGAGTTGQGWASKFSTSATNFAEVWAGTQVSPRAGIRTIASTTRNVFEATNALAFFESRNTGTNNGAGFQATSTDALMQYFAAGTSLRGLNVNSSNIFAYETSTLNFVTYPSVRPGANSFWRYNSDGTGQYIAESAIGATNLTFSGASSPVTLNSSTGTDVTLTAGTNVSFSQASNNLTINATGDGNGIYGGSGTVANGTSASLLGTFTMSTPGGNGLHLNQAGSHILGDVAGNRLVVSPAINLFTFGSITSGTDVNIRLINQEGDFVGLRPPPSLTSYTFVFPDNGDGAVAGQVVTSLGGGATTFDWPTVYLTFTHTNFQEQTITADSYDAIVIPPDLDGYTITSASYRTQSAVSGTGNIAVELVKTTSAGTPTSGFLNSNIVNGTRYITSTTNPMTVATGDLVTGLATLGTATAEGLTITLKLTK
ncbi:MAG: hypothetical protein HUU01_00545, partial [Saprospiraceae bacterium]|nr:hypothetical protein [Saprospiraceae bacterium]